VANSHLNCRLIVVFHPFLQTTLHPFFVQLFSLLFRFKINLISGTCLWFMGKFSCIHTSVWPQELFSTLHSNLKSKNMGRSDVKEERRNIIYAQFLSEWVEYPITLIFLDLNALVHVSRKVWIQNGNWTTNNYELKLIL
jgi:hypothetical protein